MNSESAQQTFRDRDRETAAVSGFSRAEEILDAMLGSIEGGELHVRPTLDSAAGSPYPEYLEIGFALRLCLDDPSRREYLIQRLRPHFGIIIGYLPAGILPHGLLPADPSAHPLLSQFRRLEDISDEEVRRWLIVDGNLIYGELKRYEIENYFDVIRPRLAAGGTMYDMGSGLGKIVMSAAVALPFAHCIGVEILAYRHQMAMERLGKMLAVGDSGLASLPVKLQPDDALSLPNGGVTTGSHLLDIRARIEFIEQDMFAVDVGAASLVFIYSTCFGSLMPRIADKLARELRPHTLVSTFTYQLSHPAFQRIGYYPAGTVAWTDAFLYEFIPVAELPPPPEDFAPSEPDTQEWEDRVRQEFAAIDARRQA